MERMVLVLGVSAGAGGARAVLTHSDQPHLPPIERCHIPRRAGAGVEAAVFEAILRMRRSADQRDELVSGVAVTTRCPLHAEAIRARAGGEPITLVDEPLAQLRYLRFTGQVPDQGTVLLYDLGASGLSVTQLDCRTDTVLAVRRSTVVAGDSYDSLLRWQLARSGVRTDRAGSRRHREALSSARVVTATDPRTGDRAVLTRSDLMELCEESLRQSAGVVRGVIEESGVRPEQIVLLGGCSRSPGLREEIDELVELPSVYDVEPEYVSARGAVLVASERHHGDVRMARLRTAVTSVVPQQRPTVGRRKVVAAVAVTVALGATIAGLLVTGRDSARPPEQGTAPTQVELTVPPQLAGDR